jgi:hypothetical protein
VASTRYSRAQQDYILALSARGLSSTEIAALCAEGSEEMFPFKAPARSVRHLLQVHRRDQKSSDPRHQDPPETDKPFMVRIAEGTLRDFRSGRLHFDSEEHLWKHMQGTIETAREYFDTDLLEHHPEWAEHLPAAVDAVPKLHVPSDLGEGPVSGHTPATSGNRPADASSIPPGGIDQAWDQQPQAREEEHGAETQARYPPQIEDSFHAQRSSPPADTSRPAGKTRARQLEEARELIAEGMAEQPQVTTEQERRQVRGMRTTRNARSE